MINISKLGEQKERNNVGHSKVDEIMTSRFSHGVKRRYRPQEALQTSERKREGRGARGRLCVRVKETEKGRDRAWRMEVGLQSKVHAQAPNQLQHG